MELQKLFVTLALDASEYQDGLDQVQGMADTAFKAVTAVVAAAAVASAAAFTAFAVDSVNAAADMEAQLSNIGAVLGATKDEIAPLATLIKDLGLNPNLKVSATEAADAIEMLARNGLNMTQILEGAAEATVLLANSTGADFATAANIGTDAMAIFKIEASDMMQAVNGITGVTVSSKFGIEDYALALAQAGGVAAASGVEFDDFNTAIAAISPLFASGSDAGTSFKVMLQRLVPASGPAAEAMADLGIIAADGSNQFFDAAGNLKSMADIASILQTALGPLSEEQRNQALSTIFGTDAMRAAVAMMDLGGQGFAELQATMSQTDALESAAMRMDNLSGAMEILEGIIDTVKLSFGQALLPVIRAVVDGLILFANEQMPVIEAAFTRLSEILIAGTPPFETFANLVAFLMQTFGASGEQVAMVQQSLLLVQQTVMTILEPVANLVASFVSWQDILIAVGLILASVVIPALLSLLATVATVAAPILATIAVVALLRTAWEQNWGGIQEKTQAVIDFVVPLVTNAIAAIKEWWAQNGDEILAKASEIWEGVKGAVTTAVEVVKTAVSDALAAIRGWWDEHGAAVMTIINTLWETAKEQFAVNLELLRLAVTGVLDGIKQFWEDHGDGVVAIVGTLWELLKETFENGKDIVTGIIEALAALLTGDWEKLKDDLLGIAEAIWDEIVAIFTAAISLVNTVIAEVVQAVKSPFEEFDWASIGNWIIDGMVGALNDGAGRLAQAAWDAAKAAWDKATSFWETGSPSKKMYELYTWVTEGGANALVDGTKSLVGAMAGMGDAAFDAAADTVGKLANVISGLDPVLALIEKLRSFSTGDSVEDVFLWLNHELLVMANAIRAGAVAFGGMVTETEAYAKLLGGAVQALADGAEVIATVREVDTGVDVEPIVLWLNAQVLKMAQAVRAGAVAFGDLIDETSAYAALAKEVIAVFAEGVGAIASIQEFVPVADIERRVADFATQLVIIFTALSTALYEAGQQLGEALQNAASMSDFVIDIVKMIKPAVDGIVAILGFAKMPGIQDFARSFASDIVTVMTEIVIAFTQATSLTAEALTKAADMARNIAAIAKVADPLVGDKGLMNGIFIWASRGRQGVGEAAAVFARDAIEVATVLVSAFTESSLATGLALDKAGRMSENIKDLFESVKKAIGAMKDIAQIPDLQTARDTVYEFTAVFLEVAIELVGTFEELVSIVGESGIAVAERIARSFGLIAGQLSAIINNLVSMSQSEINTAAIFQLLDQLPKIAMRIARVMSLVDMAQVSDLFIEWLQSFSKVNESLVASFGSLVEISQIELDTVPIFKNLGVLPFVAQRVANTLNLITSTASSPQSAVAWIKNAVDGTLAIIKKMTDLVDANVDGSIFTVIDAIRVQLDTLPIYFHNSATDSVNAMIDVFRTGAPLIAEAARNAAESAAAEARAVFSGVGVGAPSPVAVPVATAGRDGTAPPVYVYGNVTVDGSGGAGSLQEQLRSMA